MLLAEQQGVVFCSLSHGLTFFRVLYDNHVVCSPSDMLDGFVEKVFYVVVVVTLFMGQVVKTFLQFAPISYRP